MKKKFDSQARILVRLSEAENLKLNERIVKLNKSLESQGLRINFISRSQMARTIILTYLDKED